MMKMTTNNIRSYTFQKSDRLFFDTNIWLAINNPFGHRVDERAKAYSNAYREIITLGLKIFIDVNVLSEFINRSTRQRFELWKEEDLTRREVDFKTYRSSEDYKDTRQAVAAATQTILVDCVAVDTLLSRIDLVQMISDFGNGQFDINDQLIVEVCRANHFMLVTDDSDYRGVSVPILTYNRRLLS
jgi:predicted nucleic acid-binding protein